MTGNPALRHGFLSVQPLITIVTPSYNQAQFLEDTLDSVLGQHYPRLEYILMDGGSNDGSAEIIRQHSQRLAHWQSQKDDGQASAINAGFARATGGILGWLNSDDMYLPGALREAARLLDPAKPRILCGNCVTIDAAGHRSSYSSVPDKLREHDITLWDFVIQPSTFWTRAAWELVGELDETLHFSFDWDWFIRAKKAGVEFVSTERCLSVYRIHPGHKSGSGNHRREQELAMLYERHHGAKYSAAFLRMARRKSQINAFTRRLKKWRLQQRAISLVRFRFPGLLSDLTEREARHLLAMV